MRAEEELEGGGEVLQQAERGQRDAVAAAPKQIRGTP